MDFRRVPGERKVPPRKYSGHLPNKLIGLPSQRILRIALGGRDEEQGEEGSKFPTQRVGLQDDTLLVVKRNLIRPLKPFAGRAQS